MEGVLDILDNLTEGQWKTLKEFRMRVEDLLSPEYTDYVLVKYLRAKNFNLKATEKTFKENYYNRIIFGINTILDTYKKPEVAEKYEAVGILGFAKDGTLIQYTALGRQLDICGFIMSMPCYDMCLYFSYLMELYRQMLKDQNLKTGKNVQEITCIMDLEGFSLQQVLHKNVIEVGMNFLSLLQDCYPEIWSQVLVVNASKVFERAFHIFKPVLRSTILERIIIADKASSKDLLLKYIDENVLPVFLGGKRVDSNGDPECKEFISFGKKIPEEYYLRNTRIPLSPSDPNVKCLYIGQRSMCNVSAVIHEPNTKLRLQISSENGSIYVSVLYKELDPDIDVIELPEENEYLDETADNFKYKQISVEVRNQCHCVQDDALFTLPWPGLYIYRFSNARNWFTSRKVLVKMDIFPPTENNTP